jgi:benzoate-CoA ligase family protein
VLGLEEQDRVFSAAKLFFAYGLGNALSFTLWTGATACLMRERPTPAAVAQRFSSFKPTLFCGVPTLYASLLASEAELQPGSLRRCISAGEALPAEILRRWRDRTGVDILDGIGSTEMLHIFLSSRPDDVRPGTVGRPVPGYEVRICDESGVDAPVGTVGDLLVRGPSAAKHYWAQRDKSRNTFQGHWTRTGDKFSVDADGYYTYEGRADDMLKVSGIYVSPIAVESTLVSHASVLEAAVVGRADDTGLVKPFAFVVAKKDCRADQSLVDELQAFVKARLAPYKYPRWIEFVDELPKTATGKVQRFKLREQAHATRIR